MSKTFSEVARKKFRTAIILGGDGEFCAVRSCPTEAQAYTDDSFRHYRIHLFTRYSDAKSWALNCNECSNLRQLDFYHFVRVLDWPDEICRLCKRSLTASADFPEYFKSGIHEECLWLKLTDKFPTLRSGNGTDTKICYRDAIQEHFPSVAGRAKDAIDA